MELCSGLGHEMRGSILVAKISSVMSQIDGTPSASLSQVHACA